MIDEVKIRQIIREFLALDEAIFSGVGVSTTPATMSSSEKAAARRASAQASKQAATAAKRGLQPTLAPVRQEVDKMEAEELRKTIEDFKIDKVKEDPKSDERAVAATLKLASDRKITPAVLNKTVQRNKSLGAALAAAKGGAELEKAAEEDLKSKDKDPTKDASLAWQTVGDIAKKQGLA